MATVASKEPDYVRLSCRVAGRVKRQAERAAEIMGQSLTDFTEAALAEKSQNVLENEQRILLSERDFARFVALVNSPPAPTPKLREALSEYQRYKAAHPEANL